MKPQMTKKRVLGASNASRGKILALPYRGGQIKVRVIDEVGGAYKPGYSSEEVPGRTEAGQYFLAREIGVDVIEPRPPKFPLLRRGYWLRVKRLSFCAAVLHLTRGAGAVFHDDLHQRMRRPRLDEHAQRLLDAHRIKHRDYEADDVVNGAVDFLLNEQAPEWWDASLRQAKERRLDRSERGEAA